MPKSNQKCEILPTEEVPFPARGFNYRRARTPEYAQYDTDAWGNVTVSNMKLHDTFLLGRDERITIVGISAKTLKYVDGKGVTHTVRDDTDKMRRFCQRVGDRLSLECITQNNPFHTEKDVELTAIFMRDVAAARDERGVYMLTH